jgi:hypothetical protein
MSTRIETKDLDWFIDTVMVRNIGQMVETEGLHYLSFGLIAVGIEVLGACHDPHAFTAQGHSRERFKSGIDRYMSRINKLYAKFNDPKSGFFLYKFLRCGMVHNLRPTSRILFTTSAEAVADGTAHLHVNRDTGRLILVAENFYKDFARACRSLKSDLPRICANNPKLRKKLTAGSFVLAHFPRSR